MQVETIGTSLHANPHSCALTLHPSQSPACIPPIHVYDHIFSVEALDTRLPSSVSGAENDSEPTRVADPSVGSVMQDLLAMNREMLRENVQLQMLLTQYAEGIFESTLRKVEEFSHNRQREGEAERKGEDMRRAGFQARRRSPEHDRFARAPSSSHDYAQTPPPLPPPDSYITPPASSPPLPHIPNNNNEWNLDPEPGQQQHNHHSFPDDYSDAFGVANAGPPPPPQQQHSSARNMHTPSSAPPALTHARRSTRSASRRRSVPNRRPTVISSFIGWFTERRTPQIDIPSYLHDR